jgi:serine/threonine protein kinase
MPRCPNPHCQTDYPLGTVQCTNPFCLCLLPEAVVAGRYRIETLIGMGGMGTVYRANDTFEIQMVALKILSLRHNTMDSDIAIERFRREARYAHQLQHPNIVPVLNFGQDGEMLYITMPLITGGSLKNLLTSQHPLPTREAQRYLNDLATAIDVIHQHPQQIVHRDIKPSNLLIHQDDGRLMVADFGIARAMQQEKALTQRGWSLGTEHYIAPEQEQGNAEPASDIYAMGVIAYQMFTGLLPFQAVVKNHAAELPAPSTLNFTLPPTVDAVIMKAIEAEPAKRFHSGKDFIEALFDALVTENIWIQPTITDEAKSPTTLNNSNAIVRLLIPENPCGKCGRENRSVSRFCRHCGYTLNSTSLLLHDACQVGYLSNAGRQAKNNEDMILIVQGLCISLPSIPPLPFGLFALADGLRSKQSRTAGGQEASRLATETVADILLPLLTTPPGSNSLRSNTKQVQNNTSLPSQQQQSDAILEQWIRYAVHQANQVICHCNADHETTIASTLTTALVYKRSVYIASVGDSRAYHYNPQHGLHLITRDHTLAANLVEANLLHPDEVPKSPKRNQHYRYLGQNAMINIDFFQYKAEPNDLLLLCTDGLWHMLPDQQIQAFLARKTDTQNIATQLVEAANAAGGEGNISTIVVRIQ